MRWTSMDEKEMIKAWAAEECSGDLMEEYLPLPEQGKESYWCVHGQEGDISEHGFGTIPEFKGILEKELKEEFYRDLILPLAVAAFKEKEIIKPDEEKLESGQDIKKDADGFSIPDFVYVF